MLYSNIKIESSNDTSDAVYGITKINKIHNRFSIKSKISEI